MKLIYYTELLKVLKCIIYYTELLKMYHINNPFKERIDQIAIFNQSTRMNMISVMNCPKESNIS